MPVYTRPHKRKLTKRSRTLPVYGEGADKGKYFRCWNCGWICNVDRDELGDSDSSAGDEHTDFHEDHYCSTYDQYDGSLSPVGPELILNKGFEESDPPDDWTAANSADLDRHADPNTGTYCLEINENGGNHPAALQTIPVETGKQYRFSFYVKEGTGTVYQAYLYDVENAANLYSVGYWGVGTAAYVQKTHISTIPVGCVTVIVVLSHAVLLGAATTILFDDVSFRRIIPSPRSASKYSTLGGDIGHHHVALNIVTPDGEPKLIRHKYTSDISRGCPFCGTLNWRGDY